MMDNNVQPSFIPRKPLTQPAAAKPRRTISFFSIIATVIFITVLLLSGAVFGIQYYLKNQLEQKKTDLSTKLKLFESSLIADLSRLDARLSTASELLKRHVSVSAFMQYLGTVTLKSVRFTDFALAQDDQRISVSMGGEAQNFMSVANQMEMFQRKEVAPNIRAVNLTDPNLGKNGTITFKMSALVDQGAFSISKLLKAQGVSLSSTTPPRATSTNTLSNSATSTATSTATTTRTTGTTTSTTGTTTRTRTTR